MSDSAPRPHTALRKAIEIDALWHTSATPPFTPTGHSAIDRQIGGGFAHARVHDVYAATPQDASTAAGFVAMLARQRGGATLWIRTGSADPRGARLYAEGLAEIGFNPANLVICATADSATALKAANEAARCPHIATVVVELWHRARDLTLTASRRLALSAELSGATVMMLRIDALPEPSAATTRWSVASAPSIALASNAPGFPALDLTLLRQRGRAGTGQWLAVWDRDAACFADPALSRALRPAPGVRPAAPDDQRRAA